ncbi:hypothetical protein D9M72_107600 [compost metagenome]
MVADALQRSRDEDHVDGARNGARVFDHVGDEVAQRALPFLVHFLVAAHDGGGLDGVEAGEGVQRLVQHGAHVGGHVAQFDHRDVAQFGLVDAARDRGDLLGLVAGTLHVGQHLGHGHQHAQVDGGGLVPRQDPADALVDLDFVAVDFLFPLADLLDQRQVAAGQSVDGLLDHGFHQAAHLQELRTDTFQIRVELFVCVLRHPGSLRGWSHCIAPKLKSVTKRACTTRKVMTQV